jgi:putative hydrolase of the HAD superfamily
MGRFQAIGFDADDTLWHNEQLYFHAQKKFKELLAQYHSPEWIDDRLYQTEMRNLQHYGYGVKSFALSMIETALELTEERITGQDVRAILDISREMLTANVDLIEHAQDTLGALADAYTLIVITKGDLRDQERKIALTNIAQFFAHVEIVSDKTPETYARILKRYNVAPEQFLMVGNSLRSDILPVLALGGSAVYVPHELTWAHEAATPPPANQPGFYEIANLSLLPALLNELEQAALPNP